jgi:hypothetical protein
MLFKVDENLPVEIAELFKVFERFEQRKIRFLLKIEVPVCLSNTSTKQ